MARWATGNKLALALNRGGEILAFSDGHLSFARRRGGGSISATRQRLVKWRPMALEAMALTFGFEHISQRSISFVRSGGGIGLQVRRNETIVGEGLPVGAATSCLRETDDKKKAL